jgi:hypothetical protein
MNVSERKIRVTSLKAETDDLKNTTPQQRWVTIWRVCAFKEETVAESRLRRPVIRFYRRAR